MKKSLASALILGGASALTASSNAFAGVVFTDSFSSATVPSEYYRMSNDTVTDMTLSTVTNAGVLTVTPGSGASDKEFGRSFSQQTLAADGDSITFSVDFYSLAAGGPFRFGLYNLGGTVSDGTLATTDTTKEGYFTFFYNGAATASTLRREYLDKKTIPMSGGAQGTSGVRPFITQLATDSETIGFSGAANIKTLKLTVTRDSASHNTITSTLYSGGVATSYTMSAIDPDAFGVQSFNSILFYDVSSTAFDNISISFTPAAVPEPSSYAAIMGVFVVAAMGLRRKRRA